MKVCERILVLFTASWLLALPALGQSGAPATVADTNLFSIVQKRWVVAGKVTTLDGNPVAGARVTVQPTSASGAFRTLVTDFQGQFQTDYWLNLELIKEFSVDLRVSKKGFRAAHSLIDFGRSDTAWLIPITLREPGENPELLSQADLISRLLSRLSNLKASDGLSPAGEKDYARGVGEFQVLHKPDRALPSFIKVVRRDASCMPCRTMLALAELDSGDWDGAQHNLSEICKKMLADHSLGRPEPLVVLGVMESWRNQAASAAGYFAEALKYAPRDPLALQELGRSQWLLQNWEPAERYLAEALAAGADPEARLLYVEALMGAGQYQAANTEMTRYLNGRNVKTMPLRVRQLWAGVEDRKSVV